MNRRHLIALSLASLALPSATLAGSAGSVTYTPGVIKDALAAGKTVFVDYTTEWCTTCGAQKRAITALREANPDYDNEIMFVTVDYDAFGSHDVTTSRNVPRRSTLLVLRGEEELGRIVAGTSKADIQALLDLGLNASS